MYEIVSLADIKSWLGITGSSQDDLFNQFRQAVTLIVENYIGKKVVTRQFTEYYDGTGMSKLLLRNYPVYVVYDTTTLPEEPTNITVHDDIDREFDDTTLIDASDLIVYPDIGQIGLYDDEASFYKAVQNVKVEYWAGYTRFNVISGQNNYLDVKEGSGSEINIAIDEAKTRGTVWPGYSAEDLASAIQSALNDDSNTALTYTVTYSHVTQKFTVAATGTFSLLFSTGTNSSKSMATLLGFSGDDKTGSSSYTSDDVVIGVPDDLTLACQQIVDQMWQQAASGKGLLLQLSKSLPNGMGAMRNIVDELPPIARNILDFYRREYL